MRVESYAVQSENDSWKSVKTKRKIGFITICRRFAGVRELVLIEFNFCVMHLHL